MKRLILSLALTALMTASYAAAPRHTIHKSIDQYKQAVAQKMLNTGRSWHKDRPTFAKAPTQRLISEAETAFGPVSYWGTVFTPAGEEWLYSAKFTTEMINEWDYTIKGAEFTIYDSSLTPYKTFAVDFELREGETSINSVQLVPTLTRKFFNINDAYEVMVYVHATTEDYTGRESTYVYTLSDGSLVGEIEGNNVGAINTATDPWSEDFKLIFMRESMSMTEPESEDEMPDFSYYLYFDVYSKAGWGTNAHLDHTFDIDYRTIAGSGNAALPILMNTRKGNLYFALPSYEKPYFEGDWYDDTVTPDNNFIIDLYDKEYNLVKTTRIPMVLAEGAMYSFPGLGSLNGNDDMVFGVYDDSDLPVYMIGIENYISSVDDFTTSFYAYDTDGNLITTMIEDADDYMLLSDIDGYETQWCFFFNKEEDSYFKFIDYPSLNEGATLPMMQNGTMISTEFDRVASGTGYKYVSSILTADANDKGEAIHKIAWINADGTLEKLHCINLGNKVVMAQVYIGAEAFNPYLFNTDSNIEYMFLVKEQLDPESTRATESFRIYNEKSDMLLDLGPDEQTGDLLNTIFLLNTKGTNAKLIVTYYGAEGYTMCHIDLPFAQFGGGDGTAQSPYKIATPGDLLSIYLHPSANYVVTADLDFGLTPVIGNDCVFTGKIDGGGHVIKNLTLADGALFRDIAEKASISDLVLRNVTMSVSGDHNIGIIAGESISDATNGPQISRVYIDGLHVSGNGYTTFGGIIGRASLRTVITDCAVINADIDLPRGEAGGIVGMLSTGSTVTNSLCTGTIKGAIAGGIAATSSKGDEIISDCHVNADIQGREIAGGIIGESARTFINNCFVEGTVTATSTNNAYAGGIAGYLKPTYETEPPIAMSHNLSAAQVSANTDAKNAIAHRIVGYSSIDEKIVDWDSKDPNVNWEDPSTYPYLPGITEIYIKDNYAMGVDVIDSDIADDPDTTEGKTLAPEDYTAQFLSTLQWKFGTDATAPWVMTTEGLELYFEGDPSLSVTDIALPSTGIRFDGSALIAPGDTIEIFNASGMLVATGHSTIDTGRLPKGIYIARTKHATFKFAK